MLGEGRPNFSVFVNFQVFYNTHAYFYLVSISVSNIKNISSMKFISVIYASQGKFTGGNKSQRNIGLFLLAFCSLGSISQENSIIKKKVYPYDTKR